VDLTYRIVRRLLRDDDVSFSRNKYYQAYEDRLVKRAVRIVRHLRSIEHDILEATSAGAPVRLEHVEEDGEVVTLRLSYAAGGGKRTSYVSSAEWDLLLESDRVADILRDLLDEATAGTENSHETESA
jgi:hypothetical protein